VLSLNYRKKEEETREHEAATVRKRKTQRAAQRIKSRKQKCQMKHVIRFGAEGGKRGRKQRVQILKDEGDQHIDGHLIEYR
jgi:hypothetical protein